MKIIIDIPEEVYKQALNDRYVIYDKVYSPIKYGTPLHISEDGTLEITVDDYSKVNRVLVQDKNNCGGLFYADSN